MHNFLYIHKTMNKIKKKHFAKIQSGIIENFLFTDSIHH